MDKPKDIIKNQLECAILNVELDLKVLRSLLLNEENKAKVEAMTRAIDDSELQKSMIEKKLEILNLAHG